MSSSLMTMMMMEINTSNANNHHSASSTKRQVHHSRSAVHPDVVSHSNSSGSKTDKGQSGGNSLSHSNLHNSNNSNNNNNGRSSNGSNNNFNQYNRHDNGGSDKKTMDSFPSKSKSFHGGNNNKGTPNGNNGSNGHPSNGFHGNGHIPNLNGSYSSSNNASNSGFHDVKNGESNRERRNDKYSQYAMSSSSSPPSAAAIAAMKQKSSKSFHGRCGSGDIGAAGATRNGNSNGHVNHGGKQYSQFVTRRTSNSFHEGMARTTPAPRERSRGPHRSGSGSGSDHGHSNDRRSHARHISHEQISSQQQQQVQQQQMQQLRRAPTQSKYDPQTRRTNASSVPHPADSMTSSSRQRVRSVSKSRRSASRQPAFDAGDTSGRCAKHPRLPVAPGEQCAQCTIEIMKIAARELERRAEELERTRLTNKTYGGEGRKENRTEGGGTETKEKSGKGGEETGKNICGNSNGNSGSGKSNDDDRKRSKSQSHHTRSRSYADGRVSEINELLRWSSTFHSAGSIDVDGPTTGRAPDYAANRSRNNHGQTTQKTVTNPKTMPTTASTSTITKPSQKPSSSDTLPTHTSKSTASSSNSHASSKSPIVRKLSLGKTAHPSQILPPSSSREETLVHIARLEIGDGAFVRRSDNVWTYATLKSRERYGPDASLTFTVNRRGATKSFPLTSWAKFVRLPVGGKTEVESESEIEEEEEEEVVQVKENGNEKDMTKNKVNENSNDKREVEESVYHDKERENKRDTTEKNMRNGLVKPYQKEQNRENPQVNGTNANHKDDEINDDNDNNRSHNSSSSEGYADVEMDEEGTATSSDASSRDELHDEDEIDLMLSEMSLYESRPSTKEVKLKRSVTRFHENSEVKLMNYDDKDDDNDNDDDSIDVCSRLSFETDSDCTSSSHPDGDDNRDNNDDSKNLQDLVNNDVVDGDGGKGNSLSTLYDHDVSISTLHPLGKSHPSILHTSNYSKRNSSENNNSKKHVVFRQNHRRSSLVSISSQGSSLVSSYYGDDDEEDEDKINFNSSTERLLRRQRKSRNSVESADSKGLSVVEDFSLEDDDLYYEDDDDDDDEIDIEGGMDANVHQSSPVEVIDDFAPLTKQPTSSSRAASDEGATPRSDEVESDEPPLPLQLPSSQQPQASSSTQESNPKKESPPRTRRYPRSDDRQRVSWCDEGIDHEEGTKNSSSSSNNLASSPPSTSIRPRMIPPITASSTPSPLSPDNRTNARSFTRRQNSNNHENARAVMSSFLSSKKNSRDSSVKIRKSASSKSKMHNSATEIMGLGGKKDASFFSALKSMHRRATVEGPTPRGVSANPN